jgi:outer membrane protein TolC
MHTRNKTWHRHLSIIISTKVLLLGSLTSVAFSAELTLPHAIEQALSANHSIRIQKINQLRTETLTKLASSEFDPQISTNISLNKAKVPLTNVEAIQLGTLGVSHEHTNDSTAYSLSVSKKTTRGITYSGSLSVQHSRDSLVELQGGESSAAGTVSFKLSTPLNRSHSAEIVNAKVNAAEKDADASQLQLLTTVNTLVADTSNAYWSLVGAKQRQAITDNSVQNMQSLLRDMNTLINNDEIPRAELDLIQASHAEKKVNFQSASLQTLSAQYQLVLLLAQKHDSDIYLAHQALPDLADISVPALPINERSWSILIQQHRDSRALQTAIDAQNMRRKLAQNNINRPVNLSLEVSYRSLTEGGSATHLGNIYGSNNEGPSILASIEWLFPYKNTAAKAQLRDSRLTMQSLDIQLQQQHFTLRRNLFQSYSTLLSNQAQLKQQKRALERYQQSLDNEHTKRRLGQSTWINVVNLTDRVDAAETQLLSLQLNTIIAVINYFKQLDFLLQTTDDQSFTVDFSKLLLNGAD